MMEIGDYFAGHVNGSIGGLAGRHGRLFRALPWVLITSVDSLRDLTRWRVPEAIGTEVRHVGQAALVPTPAFVEAARAGAFCGFEEVWLLRDAPRSPPPSSALLVAPRDVEAMKSEHLAGALDWMYRCGCDLGMGDGIGLNYLAADEALVQAIEQACAKETNQGG